MGCVQSQNDINELHPNIFRVVNIDESGVPTGSGQLEVTESALVLHRRNKEPTIWPLKSLRRYGYDADLFSFESGRRCETGQGIYAFRCRRAEALYQTLQTFILRNATTVEELHNSTDYPVPAVSNGPAVAARNFSTQNNVRISSSRSPPNARTSIQSIPNVNVQDGNYLDPSPLVQQLNQRLDESPLAGPLSPEAVSPGSPMSNNILEVTTLNPLPSSTSHGVSNIYQVQDFSHRESNNNKKFAFLHSYSNTLDTKNEHHGNTNLCSLNDTSNINAIKNVINTLESPQKDARSSVQASYMNIDPSTLNNMQENDSEANHSYMNIIPNELQQIKSPVSNDCLYGFNSNTLQHVQRMSLPLSVSSTPIQSEERHCYENLEITDLKLDTQRSPLRENSISVPPTPTNGTREVNYIELDLENTKSDTQSAQCSSMQSLLPPESPRKLPIGYATIDFNKTVALSNSATPSIELDSEGSRKTRHNSTVTLGRNSNSISD